MIEYTSLFTTAKSNIKINSLNWGPNMKWLDKTQTVELGSSKKDSRFDYRRNMQKINRIQQKGMNIEIEDFRIIRIKFENS